MVIEYISIKQLLFCNIASGEIENCDKIIDSNPIDTLQEQFNTDMKISERANSPENEEASSSLEARALAKWSCSACTYQNWPKSSKCIMCGKIFVSQCQL